MILPYLLVQTDEAAEALDAAAVEAALSLCEENGHALSTAWEAGAFQPHACDPSSPTAVPQSSSVRCSAAGTREAFDAQAGTPAALSSLCSGQENCLAALPMGLLGLPASSLASRSSRGPELCHSAAPPQPEATAETGEGQTTLNVSMKCENENWAQRGPDGGTHCRRNTGVPPHATTRLA